MTKRILLDGLSLLFVLVLIGTYFYIANHLSLVPLHYLVIHYESLGDYKQFYHYNFLYNSLILSFLPIIGIGQFLYLYHLKHAQKDIINFSEQNKRDFIGYVQLRISFILILFFCPYFLSIFILPLRYLWMILIIVYVYILGIVKRKSNKVYNKIITRMIERSLLQKIKEGPIQNKTYPKTKVFLRISIIVTGFTFLFFSYQFYKNMNTYEYPNELTVTETSSFENFPFYKMTTCNQYDYGFYCRDGKELLDYYRLDQIEIKMNKDTYQQLQSKNYQFILNFNHNEYTIDPSHFTITQNDSVIYTIQIKDIIDLAKNEPSSYIFSVKFIETDSSKLIFSKNQYVLTYHLKYDHKKIIHF